MKLTEHQKNELVFYVGMGFIILCGCIGAGLLIIVATEADVYINNSTPAPTCNCVEHARAE